MKKDNMIHVLVPGTDSPGVVVLTGAKAIVTTMNRSVNIFQEPDVVPTPFTKDEKTYPGWVRWGTDNKLPFELTERLYKNPILASGILFNIQLAFGEGVVAGRWIGKGNEKVFEPVEIEEIKQFFDDNDIDQYLLEQITDATLFYNMFPEIIFNTAGDKIVSLTSKEASFSRISLQNPDTREIEYHYYSGKWHKNPSSSDIVITKMLPSVGTINNLLSICGKAPNSDGKLVNEVLKNKAFRYIIPLNFPTPGRTYYQKPYHSSIFDSGWFDFANKIPEFKNAIMSNQATIKYHVEIHPDHFKDIFAAEGITDPVKQKARTIKEYDDINKFLTDSKNAGKSIFSRYKQTPDGKKIEYLKITVIENHFKGGEYLDDSEEASNILSFALGVHPSLIGSAPGKSKTINGTEARELFIIKQALMRPLRRRLLRPLYMIKRVNGWPANIDFEIPNITLTTLDQGTGSKKVIS